MPKTTPKATAVVTIDRPDGTVGRGVGTFEIRDGITQQAAAAIATTRAVANALKQT